MQCVVSLCALIAFAPFTSGTNSNLWQKRARFAADSAISRAMKNPFESPLIYATGGEVEPINYMYGGVKEPRDKVDVELLRFVTGYKVGMQMLVDMTPYSSLLKGAAANNSLAFYTFIDTWSDNRTSDGQVLYMNNVTTKCFLRNTSDGNGWGVNASLLFWPRKKTNTKPKSAVTIVSGLTAGQYPIGTVGFHSANVSDDGSALLLEKEVDFSKIRKATVYSLPPETADLASLLGYVAQQTEMFTRSGDHEGLESLLNYTFDSLLYQVVAKPENATVDNKTGIISGKYNGSELMWEKGMPVYFDSSEIITDHEMLGARGPFWWNSSFDTVPVGSILSADGENVSISIDNKCFPSNDTGGMPHVLIPVSKKALPKVRALINTAKLTGVQAAKDYPRATPERNLEPMLLVEALKPHADTELLSGEQHVEPGEEGATVSLTSPQVLGELDLSAASAGASAENVWQRVLLRSPISSSQNVSDGGTVLVLTQERHGRVFKRDFNLSSLGFGDKIIMQLAVTGHGWAATAEQCGEYCHAVYRLKLNGKHAANVTQFRNDCHLNPVSPQYGTWDESRNGWCPGTVVPGIFIDVTDHVQEGTNNLAMDLFVWSNSTLSYEPYTDNAGFIFQDGANLAVAINAFVYNEDAVRAINRQERALTAAEAAIRNGSSAPERLRPPAFVSTPPTSQVLLEVGSTANLISSHRSLRKRPTHEQESSKRQKESIQSTSPQNHNALVRSENGVSSHKSIHPHTQHSNIPVLNDPTDDIDSSNGISDRFDFESRGPWYIFNTTAGDDADRSMQNVKRVEIFSDNLVQGARRYIHAGFDKDTLPDEWDQVALLLHLHKPPANLEYDHWDRVGSMGLRFER